MASYGKRMVPEYLIKTLENIENNGIAKVTTSNIKSLTNEEINSLHCGDIVAKVTGDQKHAYIVSYKEDEQGICLTYSDATYLETISYDYVGGNWVYNSQDSTVVASKDYVDSLISGALKRSIVETLPTEDIDTNTIYMVLDSEASTEGNVYNEYMYINNEWELIGTTATSGGTIYQHDINIYGSISTSLTFDVRFKIFNTSSTQFTTSTIGSVIQSLAVSKLSAVEANGLIADSSDATNNRIIIGIYSDNSTSLYLVNAKFIQMTSALNNDLTTNAVTFTNVTLRDDVRQIN